jgi:diguanylate cyclase (GGDEF)-like protein
MSWLCPTELDRRRAVDTSDRVRKARTFGAACAGVGILVLAPILSWWLVPVFVVAAIVLSFVDPAMRRLEHPERAAAGGMVSIELAVAAAAAVTGGPLSPILPWMVVPVAMSAVRFRAQIVAVGVAIEALLVIVIGLTVNATALFDHPALSIVSVTLTASVAAIALAIQGAEMQHRQESVLDPLTGLLNRKSLLPRFEELLQQAQRQHAPICMIVADLDNFKDVNDSHGHEVGDAVLQASTYEMRKCLRSFELFYRLGGEEFLAVIPGAGVPEGRELAERMRAAVEKAKPSGVEITVSLGVGVAAGDQLEFEQLFNAADQALYESKHAGRNRIASIEVLEDAKPEVLEQMVAVSSIRAST